MKLGLNFLPEGMNWKTEVTFNFFGTYRVNLSSAGNINQGLLLISGCYETGKIAFNKVGAFDFETAHTCLSGFWPIRRATSPPLFPQLGMDLWVNFCIWQIHSIYYVAGIVLELYKY